MRLPDKPSAEHLRKQAKRLARSEAIRLAAAQRRLARDYGFGSWAALMRAAAPARSPLSEAAARGDLAAVEAQLAAGAPVDGEPRERDSPLYLACASEAPDRLAVARRLIEAGAFVRRGCAGGATPLHAAARRGPAALVELLLRSGALAWQADGKGRRAHDYAEAGDPVERDRILYLTADGPRIEDPGFRAAVAAIQAGDAAALARLLDARPSLLTEPAIEPDIGPRGYFSDPMLFWFVANNPTLVPAPPPNIVGIARLMVARGVAQKDLDYTLELAMTDGAMPRPVQMALVETLVEAGARAGREAVIATLGHRQIRPIAWLLDHGLALTALEAAGLGRAELAGLLDAASDDEKSDALAMAVINRQAEAARLCLEAGADPNRFMPCHKHSTPLHQAAINDDVETLELLVAHGARRDVRDTLWRGTPLGWAVHEGRKDAEAYLRGLE
ncbi:MAG TPA: ankyrin repeat domain-containing protein [Allosphingosinicella sp.]|nr:ankyrin repeat domain-containing protein [Allosphingosinicella sp.]